jgi:hypothetical protein
VPRQFSDKVKISAVVGQRPSSISIMFYLRASPLVSRGYHVFAPHLINFDELMHFLVVITLRVLGCRQPRTPFSKSNPLKNSKPLVNVTRKILNSIWLFLDYRIRSFVLLPLTVLPRPSSVHEFFRV